MGLDTTHGAWHGAYSAFSRWREELAEVAGYTFHDMTLEGKRYGSGMQVDIDWGCIERTIGHDLFGRWPQMPVRPDGTADPLIVLLAHSDCEGEIQTEFCGPLADRLEELLPLLEGDGGGHIGSYRDKTEQFIRGLRAATEEGEPLGFH